jgi:hypothetical protein
MTTTKKNLVGENARHGKLQGHHLHIFHTEEDQDKEYGQDQKPSDNTHDSLLRTLQPGKIPHDDTSPAD